jgi:serine/threonine protein phosphatase PrpC
LLKKEEIQKEMINSPKSLSSSISLHSKKFVLKEYPNMALSSSKKAQPKKNEIVIEKKIKNIKSICKVGTSGQNQKKLNQDNFFIFDNFLNNPLYCYIGVCDGHGIFGQNISFYLKEKLPNNVQKEFLNNNIINLHEENINLLSEIINNTYQKTNKEMNEDERIDSTFSGSTCVSVIFSPERIFCINVGDSRCVLGKYNKNRNEWVAMNLSRDHKPSEPNEKQRILKNGGKVESYTDDYGNFVGPERVWMKNGEGPGLAMSRSFGDEIAHKVGVIVNPEIFDYHFVEEDKFIVVASDGIWEFMSSEEVVDIIKNYYLKNNMDGCLEYLYKESSRRWISRENIIDDITIIIAFLE